LLRMVTFFKHVQTFRVDKRPTSKKYCLNRLSLANPTSGVSAQFTGMVLFARTFCTHMVFFTTLRLPCSVINDFVLFIITLLPWLNLQTKQSLFTIQDLDIFHFVFKPIYVYLCLPRRSDDRTGVNLRLNGYFFSALINKTADKEQGVILASSHTGNI